MTVISVEWPWACAVATAFSRSFSYDLRPEVSYEYDGELGENSFSTQNLSTYILTYVEST